jgi:medium-chain acyl-[acyl-carrier-protein] hydrolase
MRSWVMRFRPHPAPSVRLFCFHHAGGGASAYRTWMDCIPAGMELCAIQLPGREGRLGERAYQRLADVVPLVVEAIDPFLDLPFVFFGHSLGALLAFEVARELAATGRPAPAHLFLSGRRAPTQPDPEPPVSQLSPAALIAEVRRRWGGIPDAVLAEPELLQLLLPTLRTDLAAVETYTYVPGAPLECPISCFGGTDDPSSRQADLAPWRQQTRATFSQRMFPGGHFFVQSSRTEVLAAMKHDLKPVLDRAGNGDPRW